MNTIMHVLDDTLTLVATIRFQTEPADLFGDEPEVGMLCTLGKPFDATKPYEIIGIADEHDDLGAATGLRLRPLRSTVH